MFEEAILNLSERRGLALQRDYWSNAHLVTSIDQAIEIARIADAAIDWRDKEIARLTTKAKPNKSIWD